MRSVPLLHAFSRPPARHFAAQYLCTVSICRHYNIELPPLSPLFAAKFISIWRQTTTVPARCLRRSRKAPQRCPHGRDNLPLPRQGANYGSRPPLPSLDFHLRRCGKRHFTFICGYETIPAPGKAVVPVGATESRCGRRSRAGRRVRSARRGGRRASRRTGLCGEGQSSAPAVRALPAAPT